MANNGISRYAGFLRMSHVVTDLIWPILSPSEQSVFNIIYRQTIGWNKPEDKISHSQFKEKTGIKGVNTIKRAIKQLKKKGLIQEISSADQIKTYSINLTTLSDMLDKVTPGIQQWQEDNYNGISKMDRGDIQNG